MNTIVKQKVIEESVTHNKMMSGKLHSAVDPQNGLKIILGNNFSNPNTTEKP